MEHISSRLGKALDFASTYLDSGGDGILGKH